MTIQDYYENYKKSISTIIDSSLSEEDAANDIAICFNIATDYEIWLECIGDRLECLLYKNAIKVYQDALGCLLEGHYQSAFMGLRYFFERTLCGVFLSANELELRTWARGERDTYWTEIVGKEGKDTEQDKTKGEDTAISKSLFSEKYVNAYFPDLKDEIKHFRRMAMSVYRECSEFVHGNPQALVQIPDSLEYKKELLALWCDKAVTIKRVIFFVFTMRYLQQMGEKEKSELADTIREEFITIKQIINQL